MRCCLVCAVVGYDTYTVAWVGDCAGLAVKKGSAELITESHCCHRADEKRRVLPSDYRSVAALRYHSERRTQQAMIGVYDIASDNENLV